MNLTEELNFLFDAARDDGSRFLDMMFAAYMDKTEIPVEDVCLVHETMEDGCEIWYFTDKIEFGVGDDIEAG